MQVPTFSPRGDRMSVEIPPCHAWVNDIQLTSCPRDSETARHFSLWVQYRGKGKWSISRYQNMAPRSTYDHTGVEDYDGGPFDPDTDDQATEKNRQWRERRRWDSPQSALAFAQTLLPTLTCNGWTVGQVLEREFPNWPVTS